jgi:hypothetical protein
MKEKWLMICGNRIIDTCMASSYNEADDIFKNRSRYIDWAESDIISESDFNHELQLNSLENQSYEG